MKETRKDLVIRGPKANVETVGPMVLHGSATAALGSDAMGLARPSTTQDNMNGDNVASANPSPSHKVDETLNLPEHQADTSDRGGTNKSQTTGPVPSSLSQGPSIEGTQNEMDLHGSVVPGPDRNDRNTAHSNSCDVHHDCANGSVVNHVKPPGSTTRNSNPVDDKSANKPIQSQDRSATNDGNCFEEHRWHWRPGLSRYVNDSPLYKHRRRLQRLMPSFGLSVPLGHEWFRSEEDARLFLEATAKYVDQANIKISKDNICPLFYDLFRKACNLYKMRLPFAARPMHVNSAIGLGFAELCTHKSDTGHAFREKTKTFQEKELEVKESEGVYRGTDVSQLRSGYWSKVRETSIIGRYLSENAGREAEHITRHVILDVLEASPEFYTLKEPAKTMVLIQNSSLSKERTLIRENKVKLSSSPLAEVVRELHREFLRYHDSEIAESSNENEREEMVCQPMTSNEFDGIRAPHFKANVASIEGLNPKPAGASSSSAAPSQPGNPPRGASLLPPGYKVIPWLTKGDQRRVAKGLQPRGQGVGHRGPGKKRKYGDYLSSKQKNDEPLEGGEERNLTLRVKLDQGASGIACVAKGNGPTPDALS